MKKQLLSTLILGASLSMPTMVNAEVAGVWQVQNADNTQQTLDTAVEEGVQEMNFFIRKIARGKLKEQAVVCDTWTLKSENNQFNWQCDQDEVFGLSLNAKDEMATKENGDTFTGTIKTGDNFIETVLTSDKGVRTNRWQTISANEMQYTAIIYSEKLPQPLTWTLQYKLAQ